eukprot:641480-Prorocentrum_lima.AAC.1
MSAGESEPDKENPPDGPWSAYRQSADPLSDTPTPKLSGSAEQRNSTPNLAPTIRAIDEQALQHLGSSGGSA